MSTDRTALGDHLTADFDAYSFGGRIEAGYHYALPVLTVTPYAALQAQSFHTPVVGGLKALDPERPIREADIARGHSMRKGPPFGSPQTHCPLFFFF
jgi:hypothetical protein